jgi:hypothetical protein
MLNNKNKYKIVSKKQILNFLDIEYMTFLRHKLAFSKK